MEDLKYYSIEELNQAKIIIENTLKVKNERKLGKINCEVCYPTLDFKNYYSGSKLETNSNLELLYPYPKTYSETKDWIKNILQNGYKKKYGWSPCILCFVTRNPDKPGAQSGLEANESEYYNYCCQSYGYKNCPLCKNCYKYVFPKYWNNEHQKEIMDWECQSCEEWFMFSSKSVRISEIEDTYGILEERYNLSDTICEKCSKYYISGIHNDYAFDRYGNVVEIN